VSLVHARALLLLLCLLLLASWIPLAGELDAETVTIDGLLPAQELARLNEARELFSDGSEAMLVALVGESEAWADSRIEELRVALEGVAGVEGAERLPDRVPLSSDATDPTSFVLALVSRSSLELASARRLNADFKRLLESARRDGETTHFMGAPRLRAESWELARRDFERLLPWLVVLVLGVPYLFFRSWRGGLFMLLCAGATTSLTLWAIRLLHGSIPAQVLLILPILWAAASVDALHVLARLADPRGSRAGGSRVLAALRDLFGPCATTSATTALGLALIGAGAESDLLRHLGLWAGGGVLLALGLTYALAPLCFRDGHYSVRGARWPFAVGVAVLRFTRRGPARILLGSAVVSVLCIWLVPRLGVSTRYPQLFAPELELSADMHAIATALESDLKPLQLLVRRSEEGDPRPIALLRSVIAVDQQVRTLPEFAFLWPDVASLLPDPEAGRPAPGDRLGESLNEWLRDPQSLPTRTALESWVDLDKGWARVDLHFHPMSWARKQAILAQLAAFDRTMLTNHELTPWGPGYSAHAIERFGIRDLLEGSLLTCLAMLAILAIALRGLRLGLVALTCSLWPLLVVAAVMAATARPWSIALLPLPGAVLGIAVDDSIHLLWSGENRRATGRLRALPAVLASTALVSLSALSLSWTSLQANRDFGLLMACGMIAALAIDLTLLPALATWLRRRETRRARS